jgi:hypothetical protein
MFTPFARQSLRSSGTPQKLFGPRIYLESIFLHQHFAAQPFFAHMLYCNIFQDNEMKLPWDTRGCYLKMGKHFLVCTKCGHKYINWIRKEEIKAANKVLKRTFDRKIAEFNEKKKLKTGKGLKKPTMEQMPLLIRCNCSKHHHSGYSSNRPNQCGDGFCKLCNCLYYFIGSTTNYDVVRIASVTA